jgi:hypothetical protein
LRFPEPWLSLCLVRPMKISGVIMLLALLSLACGLASQEPTRNAKQGDIVKVFYEFGVTAAGKPYYIKFTKCTWQKDSSNAADALTRVKKTRGAYVIASYRYHPRPQQIGKRHSDFLLFDPKSRQFIRIDPDRPNQALQPTAQTALFFLCPA